MQVRVCVSEKLFVTDAPDRCACAGNVTEDPFCGQCGASNLKTKPLRLRNEPKEWDVIKEDDEYISSCAPGTTRTAW